MSSFVDEPSERLKVSPTYPRSCLLTGKKRKLNRLEQRVGDMDERQDLKNLKSTLFPRKHLASSPTTVKPCLRRSDENFSQRLHTPLTGNSV